MIGSVFAANVEHGKEVSGEIFRVEGSQHDISVFRGQDLPPGSVPFSSEGTQLLEASEKRYLPAVVLSIKDIRRKYHSRSDFRKELSPDILLKELNRALRWYIEQQACARFRLGKIDVDCGDVALPRGAWVWVLGYLPASASIWNEKKALVINLEPDVDFLPVSALDLPDSTWDSSFTIPQYLAPIRRLPPKFSPESLL